MVTVGKDKPSKKCALEIGGGPRLRRGFVENARKGRQEREAQAAPGTRVGARLLKRVALGTRLT